MASVPSDVSILPSPPPQPTGIDFDSSNPTTALLSTVASDDSAAGVRRSHHATYLFPALLVTCASVAAAAAFAFLFFSSAPAAASRDSASDLSHTARPLAKLSRPVVLLISSDGFRYGYQFKTATPNIRRLIANGTEAEPGLISVFPTLTFPNHYSIVTGLYPPYHGIVNNHFVDPISGDSFTMKNHEPKWWLGEPLWETVVDQGFRAATFFWPGSEVKKGSWDCPPRFCRHYDGSVPFEDRVDTILSYFDLPCDEIPVFMTLYFEDPDKQGHKVGADDPEITAAVARIDHMIGRLVAGLEKKGIFEDVTIILLGDHGMVGTCDKKLIFLDALSPWIKIPRDWIESTTPLLAIRPPERGPAGAASLFCELQNSTHYWIAGRRVQGGAEDVQELRMQRLAWLRQRILLDEDHFYCARTSACKGKEDPIFRECRDLQCDRVHSEAEGGTQQRIRIVSKHSSSRQCLRCTQNMRMNEFSEAATLPATDLAKIWKIKRGTVAKRSRRFQFICSMHLSSYVTISGLRFGLPPIVKFSNRNMINNTC